MKSREESYEEGRQMRLLNKNNVVHWKNFSLFCTHHLKLNQEYQFAVDDVVSEDEFDNLNLLQQTEYMLYHQFKDGQVTAKQLMDFDWFAVFMKWGEQMRSSES